jgi:hypothetical protein
MVWGIGNCLRVFIEVSNEEKSMKQRTIRRGAQGVLLALIDWLESDASTSDSGFYFG